MTNVKSIGTSSTVTLGLMLSFLGLAFTAGVGWQRITTVERRQEEIEADNAAHERIISELKELSADSKRRIDYLERMANP